MKKLIEVYHISEFNNNIILEFTPRRPQTPLANEDRNTPRVSVAKNITDCIKGHPYAYYHLFLNPYNTEDTSDFKDYFESRMIDLNTGQVFLLYLSYKLIVKEESLIPPTELFRKGLVPDALDTKEYWLLENAKPVDCKFLMILDNHLLHNKNTPAEINYILKDSIDLESFLSYELFTEVALNNNVQIYLDSSNKVELSTIKQILNFM